MSLNNLSSTTKLDSHANCCLVGRNALILSKTNKLVRLTGYDDTGLSKLYKIVYAAVAYNDLQTGEAVMLTINQAVWVLQLGHNLLCPMQMQVSGIRLNKQPKFLTCNLTVSCHAISIPDDLEGKDYVIPLLLKGIDSYFSLHWPMPVKFKSVNQIYALTQEEPVGDPHSSEYAEIENKMMD